MQMDQHGTNNCTDPAFRALYKTGAVAAFAAAILFRRNLDAEWLLLRGLGLVTLGPSQPPSAIQDWLALLHQQPLLGLTLLNIFDLVNYALVGLIFLALIAALWHTHSSGMAIAAALAVTGVAVYFASNQALALLSLSRAYAAAAGESQHALILAAGQAALALHQVNASYAGQGLYPSFLLVSVAGLLLALAMLRSAIFSKGTAWMGITANAFHLSYYAVLIFAPALVAIPISISAVFLLIWYLKTGARLWRLAAW